MTIFKSVADFERFYKLILKYSSSERYGNIKILAYSFLPNHFHFIISVPGGEVSSFLGDIQNSYGKYFNTKYERRGQLFEWRFKAKLIQDEEYLARCMSYVCFNPIKHKLTEDIHNYPWTSYHQLSDKKSIDSYKDLILDELEI